MWINEPAYRTWEEWVDRDERDLSMEGVLGQSPNGLRVDGRDVDELLRPWIGKRVRVDRRVLGGRLVLTVVEVD